MNAHSSPHEQYEVFPSPVFDPFPEPQTMPKGWDLSEILSSSNGLTAESANPSVEA